MCKLFLFIFIVHFCECVVAIIIIKSIDRDVWFIIVWCHHGFSGILYRRMQFMQNIYCVLIRYYFRNVTYTIYERPLGAGIQTRLGLRVCVIAIIFFNEKLCRFLGRDYQNAKYKGCENGTQCECLNASNTFYVAHCVC